MKREFDGRAGVLAAAALGAAFFAARPAETLPRLEPGFGKPRRAAELPPLPRGEALRGPTAQVRFDEILHDAPADVSVAVPAAETAGGRDAAERPKAAVRPGSKEKTESGGGGAAPSRAERRSIFSADEGRPETSARAPSPSRIEGVGGRAEPARETRRSPEARRGSRELFAGDAVRAPSGLAAQDPAARGVRHPFGSRESDVREDGNSREDRRDVRGSGAAAGAPLAGRESALFGRVKTAERGRIQRRRPPEERRKRRERKTPRFRPLLLAKLLGSRALHPPPSELEPPPMPPLPHPARGPAGKSLPAAPAGLDALDDVDPARLGRDRRRGAHWDGDQFHDGDVRGLVRGGESLLLRRDGANWWAFAGGGAQLRRDGVWWTKENGVWFVVHDGAPWAWRSFQDWNAEGLFHPASGTEMVYSRDFARVALVTPGEGAEVFDAKSGEKLADIPENLMPPRRRPKAPSELPLPSDVFAQ